MSSEREKQTEGALEIDSIFVTNKHLHLNQAGRRWYDPKFPGIYVEGSRSEIFEAERRNNAVAGLNVYLSIRSASPRKTVFTTRLNER